MKLNQVLVLVGALSLTGVAAAAVTWVATDHDHSGGDFTHVGEVPVLHHGGGLDQCGGHHNRKTGGYHYHRAKRC